MYKAMFPIVKLLILTDLLISGTCEINGKLNHFDLKYFMIRKT